MAKPNKPRPVAGRAGLSKAQAEATKRIKAMTPTQRKAYQAQNKKNAVRVVATAASVIPAGRALKVGMALKGAGVAKKATGIRDAKGLTSMKKALSGSKGPARNTPASKPTSQLERNIGRTTALRKKFPEKYNPTVKKK